MDPVKSVAASRGGALARSAPDAKDAAAPGPRQKRTFIDHLRRFRRKIDEDIARDLTNRRGFLWWPVLFGVMSALYFALPFEPPHISALPLPAVALGLLLRSVLLKRPVPLFVMIALVAGCGFLAAKLAVDRAAAPRLAFERSYEVSGIVERVEDRDGRGFRLVLAVLEMTPKPADGLPLRVRLTARSLDQAPHPGEILKFSARLGPPQPPLYPGGYDFARVAYFDQIGGVGYSLGKPQALPLTAELTGTAAVMASIEHFRQQISSRIREALPGVNGAIAAALIVGDRGAIDPDIDEAMRISGLSHVLSISGLHMALVAACLFGGLRFLLALFPPLALRFPIKKVTAAVALVGTIAYLVISGLEVPASRSAVMIGVALLAVMMDRRALSLRVIAIAALVILVFEPDAVLDPGAQMSFAAVVALVAGFEALARRTKPPADGGDINPVVRLFDRCILWVAGAMMTSLIAGLATAPIALYHFDRAAPLGLIANLLATPLISFVIMPFALLSALAMAVGLEAWPLMVMGWGIDGMVDIARLVADYTYGGGIIGRPWWPAVILTMAGGLWMCLWTRRTPLFGLPVIAVGLVLMPFGERPDLVVAEDGERVMVLGAFGAPQLLGRAKGFQSEIWLAVAGSSRPANDPELVKHVTCDPDACVFWGEDGKKALVSLVRRPRAFGDECNDSALVITALAAPGWCFETTQVLDQSALQGRGTVLYQRETSGNKVAYREIGRSIPANKRPWQ